MTEIRDSISVNDIKDLIIPAEFGIDEDEYENASFNSVIAQMGEDTEFNYGVSKFVIFPKENDIVVKIPFNGMFDYNGDSEDYTDFSPFKCSNDYCADEAEMFELAKEAGVDEFFAATKYAGKTKNGVPYYISDRITQDWKICDTVKPSDISVKTADKYQDECSHHIPHYWLAQAIEYYGGERVINLLNFIDENDINDIHNGNVGCRENGAPVIFDYSGWSH